MSYSGKLSITQACVEVPAEDTAAVDIQRRIVLSFCATVMGGVLLGMGYIAQRAGWITPLIAQASTSVTTQASSDGFWLNLPNPPAPLPDSASPYAADVPSGNAGSPLKLEMSATQDAWVQVETDGHVTFAKLVRAAGTLTFEASNKIRMVTGNAPGLDLRFNGTPVPATGAKGHVRTLEFTSEGLGQPVTKS